MVKKLEIGAVIEKRDTACLFSEYDEYPKQAFIRELCSGFIFALDRPLIPTKNRWYKTSLIPDKVLDCVYSIIQPPKYVEIRVENLGVIYLARPKGSEGSIYRIRTAPERTQVVYAWILAHDFDGHAMSLAEFGRGNLVEVLDYTEK